MAETTENEDIDRVEVFEGVDYSDKITVADGAKLVINSAPGHKMLFNDNLTDPIEFSFTEGKKRENRRRLFIIQQPFLWLPFQPFKPEKELVFSLRQVFVHD